MEAGSQNEIEAVARITQDCDLEFKPVSDQQRSELLRLLEESAKAMRVDAILPDFPERGFLQKNLEHDEAKAIDEGLGPIYREEAMLLQAKLKDIRIEDCGEALEDVQLRFEKEGLEAVFCNDEYRADAQAFPRTFWGRHGFVDRLTVMTRGFNQIGLRPFVHDLFRVPGVQEGLYSGAYELVRKEMGLSGQALIDTVNAMVASCPAIAAHKGAAAVDIFLQDRNGDFLDLGNSPFRPGPATAIKFPFVTHEQFRTRQLYSRIAQMAGCTVYPFEDWHSSYGDAFAALGRGESACNYGPIESFDASTGAVVPYSIDKIWKEFPRPAL